MNELITDRSVWANQELLQRPDWLVEITDEELAEIMAAVVATGQTPIEQLRRDDFSLPLFSKRLEAVQHSLETGSGATLVRGLASADFTEAESTRAFLGISQYIGTPVSQSAAGERIFHVRDSGFQDGHPGARGPNTKKKLHFHTDRCDVIGFMCLKQAKSGGENFLVSSSMVYNQIASQRPDLLSELSQPFHYQRHNVDLGNRSPYCRQPVFSFTEGRFACSFLRILIDRAYASGDVPAMTDRQCESLDFLEQTCERPEMQYRFYQQPGDMLFLNNWTTLHRRSEFVDHEDPAEKRHLLRVWLSVPNSRPIDPLFQDNFGATEAGSLRGGMQARLTP